MSRSTKYVSLDVHQATTVASVREERGRVIARSVVPTEAAALLERHREERETDALKYSGAEQGLMNAIWHRDSVLWDAPPNGSHLSCEAPPGHRSRACTGWRLNRCLYGNAR